MQSIESTSDRIFARTGYTLRHRIARRTRWMSEAQPSYVVLFLLAGKLRWKSDDNDGDATLDGEVLQQSALLVNPGETITAHGEQTDHLVLTLAPAFVLDCAVRSRLTRADARIDFRARVAHDDERLARLARDLADELFEETAGQEIVIAALVEQALVQLLRRHTNIRSTNELELSRAGLVDRRIRRAVELMHAHMDRELPLEEIAAAAYLSPFHFARLFKKLTGASPHAYLANLRAARAQTLLAETDLSITEIGARVGYASSSHFAKAFRHATGLSPRAFRAALVLR